MAVCSRCGEGKHPLMNTIKNGLLDLSIDYGSLHPSPVGPTTSPSKDPINQIEEDLDDIEVSFNRPTTRKPTKLTIRPETQKPIVTTPIPIFKEEKYKIVCYYTNWAWYR